MYSCHLSTSSASVGSLLFLSFIVPVLAQNVPLISPIFLKWSLFFPSLLFSFISCISNRSSYLSLLFCGTLHSVECTFPCLPCLSLLFSSQLFVKPPQATTLPSFISLSWGRFWSLSPVRCYEHLSIVLQALRIPDLIPWIYSSPPLWWFDSIESSIQFTIKFFNCKGSDLGHTWMA